MGLARTGMLIGLVGSLALPCAGCESGPVDEVPPDIRQALLMVDGLNSATASQKVRAELRRTRGVTGVVMDLPNAEALVTFDANLANEYGLQEAVEAAGFDSHLGDLEGP